MSIPKVPKPNQAATSACAKNKEGAARAVRAVHTVHPGMCVRLHA